MPAEADVAAGTPLKALTEEIFSNLLDEGDLVLLRDAGVVDEEGEDEEDAGEDDTDDQRSEVVDDLELLHPHGDDVAL